MPRNSQSRVNQVSAEKAVLVFLACLIGLFCFRRIESSAPARPSELQPRTQLDLNSTTTQDLEQLPGIGPSLAAKIVEHRQQHGRFETIGDLQRVPGIGDKTIDRLRPWLTITKMETIAPDAVLLERKPQPNPAPVFAKPNKIQAGEPPIDINSADATALQRLPGIGPALAARILAHRAEKPFATIDDLRQVKGIGVKTLENLRPYITVK
jgi:competence protein ComEA